MAATATQNLGLLYEQDETSWLGAMAELAASGHYDDMDLANLREYRTDLANRDRREVFSRLVVVLGHLLKWQHQPARRGGSWKGTIRELRQLLERGTLRNHASAFPVEKPWTFDDAWTW